jgi:hypothetical protein
MTCRAKSAIWVVEQTTRFFSGSLCAASGTPPHKINNPISRPGQT